MNSYKSSFIAVILFGISLTAELSWCDPLMLSLLTEFQLMKMLLYIKGNDRLMVHEKSGKTHD